ncbi:MAG TPA: hypothetical protein VGJ18_10165 [Gemmatimonadaceae bacterium]|jgi:hypothetical protein
MSAPRVPLYTRLPEIHRLKDAELEQPGQLRDYVAIVERAFGEVHRSIESLYDDLFIETCDPWVIPYIGDLLGTSHLSGDDWTLRADVADTIALRRRKGTLGALELLAYDLTGWGSHCVELRELLAWTQHLNHQRPDAGGDPPYAQGITRFTIPRGGTIPLRDPASLSLLGTPFDTFAHTADVRPAATDSLRINLPNLAIFLWRLAAYRVAVSKPVWRGTPPAYSVSGAPVIARFDIHPMGQPVRLFNTGRFAPDARPLVLSRVDEVPGPIPTARLSQGEPAGRPDEYVSVDTYDETDPTLATLIVHEQGLQLHLPDGTFNGDIWKIRGENLCAWERGIWPPLLNREIAIDPVIGRVAFGLATAAERTALKDDLLVTYTYGAVGPVGAHPISRLDAPTQWLGETVQFKAVDYHLNASGLQNALDNIENSLQPIVIEIRDSMTHDLDLAAVAGVLNEAGGPNLRLNRTLIIRAADGERPVIQLARPLRFRPTNVLGANPAQQDQFDAVIDRITVRLEGLYLTRDAGFAAGDPLIARVAVHSLELVDCTLDPGGYEMLGGGRAPIRDAVSLEEPYGFPPATEGVFKPTPEVHLQRSIAGPMRLDDGGYTLFLEDSIVDAGAGVADNAVNAIAVGGSTDPVNGWAPPTQMSGLTVFGRIRVGTLSGRGGIFVHQLEVLDNQKGCIKFSWFSSEANRLPQNHACVQAPDAPLSFTDEWFGSPAYGQLARVADFRILERGPGDDAMGAFGFLLEAHRWHNLNIRFREFMPLGVRPLLVPVT